MASAGHRWASQLASALRPAQDELLRCCGLGTAAQLLTAGILCLKYPRHGEGMLVPLYAAGYACLAILVLSQRGRRLKGRVRMEIEAGEGERHSVMAQGTRLAARDYVWATASLHLATQAAAGAAAAVRPAILPPGGGGGGEVQIAIAAASGGAVGSGASSLSLVALVLALAYGVLAALYGLAGAFKFVPGLRGADASP